MDSHYSLHLSGVLSGERVKGDVRAIQDFF